MLPPESRPEALANLTVWLVPSQNLPALVLKIMSGTFAPISDRYSPELRQLVLSLLSLEPAQRPPLSHIMAQPLCIRALLNLHTDVGSVRMRRPVQGVGQRAVEVGGGDRHRTPGAGAAQDKYSIRASENTRESPSPEAPICLQGREVPGHRASHGPRQHRKPDHQRSMQR